MTEKVINLRIVEKKGEHMMIENKVYRKVRCEKRGEPR